MKIANKKPGQKPLNYEIKFHLQCVNSMYYGFKKVAYNTKKTNKTVIAIFLFIVLFISLSNSNTIQLY